MTREEFMKMHLNALYGTAVTYKFKSDRFKYLNTDSIRKEKKKMKVVQITAFGLTFFLLIKSHKTKKREKNSFLELSLE